MSLNAVNPSAIHPITDYIWHSTWQGTVDFSKDNNLNIKPTTASPSNSMGGQWQLDSATTFRTSGLFSTKMGVPEQTQELEHFMSTLFSNRNNVPFTIQQQDQTGDFASLTIPTPNNNEQVTFLGKIKPESKFKSTPTIEFFDIKPSTTSPSGFEIRKLEIDSDGITHSQGVWKPYKGEINDLNNDLALNQQISVRVKKFAIPPTTAQPQQSFAYFKDLIFSTSIFP